MVEGLHNDDLMAVLSDPALQREVENIPESDPERRKKTKEIISNRYPHVDADSATDQILQVVDRRKTPPPRISQTVKKQTGVTRKKVKGALVTPRIKGQRPAAQKEEIIDIDPNDIVVISEPGEVEAVAVPVEVEMISDEPGSSTSSGSHAIQSMEVDDEKKSEKLHMLLTYERALMQNLFREGIIHGIREKLLEGKSFNDIPERERLAVLYQAFIDSVLSLGLESEVYLKFLEKRGALKALVDVCMVVIELEKSEEPDTQKLSEAFAKLNNSLRNFDNTLKTVEVIDGKLQIAKENIEIILGDTPDNKLGAKKKNSGSKTSIRQRMRPPSPKAKLPKKDSGRARRRRNGQ